LPARDPADADRGGGRGRERGRREAVGADAALGRLGRAGVRGGGGAGRARPDGAGCGRRGGRRARAGARGREGRLHRPDGGGALARHAGELRLGRGDDPATELGPLVSERQRARVEDLVAEARERGAEALVGGRRPDLGLPGWFYEPTVLAGGDGSARLEREEV